MAGKSNFQVANGHSADRRCSLQTLLLPVCFEKIGEKTYYLFGIANAISIPVVWAFYPESNQRTLEEIDLLFASDSPFNWVAEKNFAKLKLEHPDIVAAARHNENMLGASEVFEDGIKEDSKTLQEA